CNKTRRRSSHCKTFCYWRRHRPAIHVWKWHAASDQRVRESGLAFTFLPPNSFMQNFINYFPPRDGAIYLPWGNGRASFVDARDIASVAARALTNEAHKNKIYTLTGPAD